MILREAFTLNNLSIANVDLKHTTKKKFVVNYSGGDENDEILLRVSFN